MSTASETLLNQLIETPLGPFRACWSENGLYCFEFLRDHPEDIQWSKQSDLSVQSKALTKATKSYFKSGVFEFELDDLDWLGVSDFNQVVLRNCYLIGPGKTVTYGELAAKSGSPAAARAVGSAMARNRWPLLVPCHRVVGSNGKMTGYSGVGGIETKRRLLALEQEFFPLNGTLS